MKTSEFEGLMSQLFGEWLKEFKDDGEYGFTYRVEKEIKKIAYATNLTRKRYIRLKSMVLIF